MALRQQFIRPTSVSILHHMLPQSSCFSRITIVEDSSTDRLVQSRELHVGGKTVFFHVCLDLVRIERVVTAGCGAEGFQHEGSEGFATPFFSAGWAGGRFEVCGGRVDVVGRVGGVFRVDDSKLSAFLGLVAGTALAAYGGCVASFLVFLGFTDWSGHWI